MVIRGELNIPAEYLELLLRAVNMSPFPVKPSSSRAFRKASPELIRQACSEFTVSEHDGFIALLDSLSYALHDTYLLSLTSLIATRDDPYVIVQEDMLTDCLTQADIQQNGIDESAACIIELTNNHFTKSYNAMIPVTEHFLRQVDTHAPIPPSLAWVQTGYIPQERALEILARSVWYSTHVDRGKAFRLPSEFFHVRLSRHRPIESIDDLERAIRIHGIRMQDIQGALFLLYYTQLLTRLDERITSLVAEHTQRQSEQHMYSQQKQQSAMSAIVSADDMALIFISLVLAVCCLVFYLVSRHQSNRAKKGPRSPPAVPRLPPTLAKSQPQPPGRLGE